MIKPDRIDILLLQYAAGSLGTSKTIVVVALLIFNPDARRKVTRFEALGGQIIREEPPASISPACLESVLEKIDGGPRMQSVLRSFLRQFLRF